MTSLKNPNSFRKERTQNNKIINFLRSHRQTLFLTCIYLITLSFYIGKAFQNDDSFHLEAAQWIAAQPDKPMSGVINWNEIHPLYDSNQPPFYFFLLSFSGQIFGYTEWGLHLFQSLFILFAVTGLFKIAKIAVPKYPYFATALIIFTPALIPNINLGVDIPIFTFHIWIFLLVIKSVKNNRNEAIIIGILLSLSILTKYTSIALLPAMGILALTNRKLWLSVLIVLLSLILWSIWNIHEFGFIHILSKAPKKFSLYLILYKTGAYLLALGSMSPFTILLIKRNSVFKKKIRYVLISLGLLFIFSVLAFLAGFIEETINNWILWTLFIINSFLLAFTFLNDCTPKDKILKIIKNKTELSLWLWMLAIASFIILFAPFIATRHILLSLPPLIFLLIKRLDYLSTRLKLATLSITIILTCLLAISDWLFADFYRKESQMIGKKIDQNSKIFFSGQLGWQWYAKKQGMIKYEAIKDTIEKGDFFVIATNTSAAPLPEESKFKIVKKEVNNFNWFRFFSTSNKCSYYRSDARKIPWNLTKQSTESLLVFRCIEKITPKNSSK